MPRRLNGNGDSEQTQLARALSEIARGYAGLCHPIESTAAATGYNGAPNSAFESGRPHCWTGSLSGQRGKSRRTRPLIRPHRRAARGRFSEERVLMDAGRIRTRGRRSADRHPADAARWPAGAGVIQASRGRSLPEESYGQSDQPGDEPGEGEIRGHGYAASGGEPVAQEITGDAGGSIELFFVDGEMTTGYQR